MELPTIQQVAESFAAKAAGSATTDAAAPAAAADATPAADAAATPPPADAPAEKATEAAATVAAADPAPAAAATPKPDPTAARFAALARREKEARDRMGQAEARVREAEARESAAKEAATSAAAKKFENPIELLKTHGFSLEDANLAAFGKFAPKPVDPMDTKINERLTPVEAQLKEARDTVALLKQTLDQYQTERVEIAKREVRRDILETAKKENCELIQAVGEDAVTLVQNVMAHFFNNNKQTLTYSEACGKVEEYYTDAISRLAATQKIRAKLAPAATASATATPTKESAKTLTQAHTPPGSKVTPDVDKMSKNEAIDYLAKKLTYRKS